MKAKLRQLESSILVASRASLAHDFVSGALNECREDI